MPEALPGPVHASPGAAAAAVASQASRASQAPDPSGPSSPDPAGREATGVSGAVALPPEALATQLVRLLGDRGWTAAVAESLTGGMVAASIVDVPGASRVLRGGVVAYATDLKTVLLGVDAALLAERGPVDPRVAEQMAQGARQRLGADVGLATTGVAGPADQDGHPPGEVHVAVATDAAVRVESLRLAGDRAAIRAGACRAVLSCAVNLVGPTTVEGEHPGAG